MADGVDYDEQARILFKSVGLPATGTGPAKNYNDLDPIWCNEATGGKVYVGNASVANNKPKLAAHGIASVVNCQDITATNFFESDKAFTYFRFPISHWSSDRTHDMATDAGVLGFFAEVWAFIKKVTDGGGSVLVHCLAGAHRAGTTGVAWLMHASGLDKATAIRTAKLCRSAINPIFGLVTLLDRLDPAIANRRLQAQR